ncbi:hypothetical protein SAMN06269185_3202 [Natronoarchaeum philippinense]|uniref:DUF2795 domain-containing protein n=1 Tax=Natronoarchaeum philippinense TaxID=558529 RepID=A0A285P8J2_NATPI|nr:DUF2795 domain-containing protein [Natronoarchaeum philippinense]SNZ18032.1 hypothetical protein SAMN06269185_3202 [Natronoarchaeum philippinense]
MMRRTHELLTETEYPITTDELVERYGDQQIELADGTETVGEILARLDGETYEHKEDAEFAIYSAVSDRAIGRKGYSDRDPTPLGSPHGPDQVSF